MVLSITDMRLPSREWEVERNISRLRCVAGSTSTHFLPENLRSARKLPGRARRFSVT